MPFLCGVGFSGLHEQLNNVHGYLALSVFSGRLRAYEAVLGGAPPAGGGGLFYIRAAAQGAAMSQRSPRQDS